MHGAFIEIPKNSQNILQERVNSLNNLYSPQINDFFKRLQDEESRFIFNSCFEYLLTSELSHKLRCIAGSFAFAEKRRLSGAKEWLYDNSFMQLIRDYHDKKISKVILWAAGSYARFIFGMLKQYGVDVHFFVDKSLDKQGTIHCNRLVISPQELVDKHLDSAILVASNYTFFEIEEELLNMGLFSNGITKIYSLCKAYEVQYFGPEFIKPVNNEIYLDVGAYDKTTPMNFINFATQGINKMILFEPSPTRIPYLQNLECGNLVPELVTYGAWSYNGYVNAYENCDGQFSAFSDDIKTSLITEKECKLPVKRIDDVVGNDKVTFIKMDIEGAELQALIGAEETICNNKPRLAISIYHKPEDIVDIPLYLSKIVPEYRFFIRHHTLHPYETVLYALI